MIYSSGPARECQCCEPRLFGGAGQWPPERAAGVIARVGNYFNHDVTRQRTPSRAEPASRNGARLDDHSDHSDVVRHWQASSPIGGSAFIKAKRRAGARRRRALFKFPFTCAPRAAELASSSRAAPLASARARRPLRRKRFGRLTNRHLRPPPRPLSGRASVCVPPYLYPVMIHVIIMLFRLSTLSGLENDLLASSGGGVEHTERATQRESPLCRNVGHERFVSSAPPTIDIAARRSPARPYSGGLSAAPLGWPSAAADN